MSNNIYRIVCMVAVGVFATALTVRGGTSYDLGSDGVDINTASNWTVNDSSYWNDGDNAELEAGNSGYLSGTYSPVAGSMPDDSSNGGSPNWTIYAGHLEFRSGAVFSLDGHTYQIRSSDNNPESATTTVKSGASFATPNTSLKIGHTSGQSGTFTVDGGTVNIGGDVDLDGPSSSTALFEVVGSGGSITVGGDFDANDAAEVSFELDNAGDVMVVDTTTLSLFDNPVLKIDTSAFETSSGSVDLFTYDNMWNDQVFANVTVLDGSDELTAGNGTDDMTYDLDYGAGWTTDNTAGTVSLTYNNVPEPSSLILLGLGGLLLMKRRLR